MRVFFERSFARDLKKIRNRRILKEIGEVISLAEEAESFSELTNLKKLEGYTTYYRIRVGDYRIGLEIVEDKIIFVRVLNRKEIYRYFA